MQVESDMQVMHAYASVWMLMQVMYMQDLCDMQVMHAYASIWILMQDRYMLKWHDMQVMQVCECLCKYVNAYASYVYA